MRSSSSASRSAGVTGAKNGSMPASSASSRRSRAQNAWKVETHSSSHGVWMQVSSRSRISAAAPFEKVSARMASAGVPSSTSQEKRSTSVRVLPVPAPASTSSGPPGWVTASSCAALRAPAGGGIAPRISRLMGSPNGVQAALSADWLGASRRAAEAARRALARHPEYADRARETGRGEGGDMTLAIDRAVEDAVLAELESFGVGATVVSEERGVLEVAGGGPVRVC